MDPERQVAQLHEGGLRFIGCPIEAASDFRVAGLAEFGPGDPQLEAQRDEPLLGAVMEVALDPPALEIPGLDDPCARGADLLELRFDLGRQPIVLDRQPHGAGNRGDQARLLEEDRVVDDRGLPDAVPLEHRDGLARAVFGQLHRLAGRIDEPILAGRPVGHLQGGITERVGEGIAEAGRRRGLPQLDDEVRDAGAGHPGPEDHEQDRDRDRDLGQEDQVVQRLERDPGREEDPRRRLQEDRDGAREDGRHLAPNRAAGSQPAPTERDDEEHGAERDDRSLDRVDHVGGAHVGRDAQRVQASSRAPRTGARGTRAGRSRTGRCRRSRRSAREVRRPVGNDNRNRANPAAQRSDSQLPR